MTYNPNQKLRPAPARDLDEVRTQLAHDGEAVIPVGIFGSIKGKARLRHFKWSYKRINARYYRITLKSV